MSERWRVVVELTWDIDPEDTTPKYEGDAEVDFANRGLARVREHLERLVDLEKCNQSFAHYHILEQPKRVQELD